MVKVRYKTSDLEVAWSPCSYLTWAWAGHETKNVCYNSKADCYFKSHAQLKRIIQISSHFTLLLMQELASSGSEENSIDLESLSKYPHPCLASGNFSIFNSPDVVPLRLAREMECIIDMDGVVLSKLVLDSHTHRHTHAIAIHICICMQHAACTHDIVIFVPLQVLVHLQSLQLWRSKSLQ